MIKIRFGVFETNSSSTHSIVMCSSEEFQAFKTGELLLDHRQCRNNGDFSTIDDAIKWSKRNGFTEFGKYKYDPDCFSSYEDFINEEPYMDSFEEHYITRSGEEIVAFGKYGYDG